MRNDNMNRRTFIKGILALAVIPQIPFVGVEEIVEVEQLQWEAVWTEIAEMYLPFNTYHTYHISSEKALRIWGESPAKISLETRKALEIFAEGLSPFLKI